MVLVGLWKLLHLFFAFSFVGSLVVAEWNGRAARATHDWNQRAILFQIVHLSSRLAGMGGLFMLGVFGNLTSIGLGYSMRHDAWLRWVNGIWVVALACMGFLSVPSARRLADASRLAAQGGEPEGYDRWLRRWRFANVVQSALYLTALVLMVFHWRS